MSNELLVLSFAEAKQPEYKEKKGEGGGYIEFGYKNDYPNYLVDLFNKSAKHNAIIKGKVNYIYLATVGKLKRALILLVNNSSHPQTGRNH